MNQLKPKIIDLFAGVGGLSLGGVRAGFDLVAAVELDKHAMAAHHSNFPNVNHIAKDIASLQGRNLLAESGLKEGELDGLIGGPPCQGFSSIGEQSPSDSRNDLFIKFFDLVKQCSPVFFVVENVPGILNKKYDEIRKRAIRQLEKDYTLLEPMIFNAADFGAPTIRERVFFIGHRSDIKTSLSLEHFNNVKVRKNTTVADALYGLPTHIRSDWQEESQGWREVSSLPQSRYWNRISGRIPDGVGEPEAVRRYREDNLVSGCLGTRHTPAVAERYRRLKPGEHDPISRCIRLKLDGLCPTLRAGTGPDRGSYQAVRPVHPTATRVITPREAARLQGFPDWFRFAPAKWHTFRQIGNSVSPLLAESIFKIIRSDVFLINR